jgi:hypothetical protein
VQDESPGLARAYLLLLRLFVSTGFSISLHAMFATWSASQSMLSIRFSHC